MDPKQFAIQIIWVYPGSWSVRCGGTKHEIMQFNLPFCNTPGKIRLKVEQFLKGTPYEGRRVQVMTGPDDAGRCYPIAC